MIASCLNIWTPLRKLSCGCCCHSCILQVFCSTLEERGWREGRPGPGMHEAHTGRSRAEPNRTEQNRSELYLHCTEQNRVCRLFMPRATWKKRGLVTWSMTSTTRLLLSEQLCLLNSHGVWISVFPLTLRPEPSTTGMYQPIIKWAVNSLRVQVFWGFRGDTEIQLVCCVPRDHHNNVQEGEG